MRHYPTNSPEALARVVAIAMMADGAIDSSELKSLERHDIIKRPHTTSTASTRCSTSTTKTF